MTQYKTATITAYNTTVKEIEKAEKEKARLENMGYTLQHTKAGLFYSVLTYVLIIN
jgi:hypothetical protein